jgi:hypothetical protein
MTVVEKIFNNCKQNMADVYRIKRMTYKQYTHIQDKAQNHFAKITPYLNNMSINDLFLNVHSPSGEIVLVCELMACKYDVAKFALYKEIYDFMVDNI